MQSQTFYSNGKLLLTGEYVVLDGAKALAVPTRMGQNLIVAKGANQEIEWTSFDADGSIWFQDIIPFEGIKNKQLDPTNEGIRSTLIEILHQAHLQNPAFLKEDGYKITTRLSFPRIWGLGTSSTLLNNIGQWLQIDPFELLNKSFGGSGYDIACAQTNLPIVYQLENNVPHFKPVHFNPKFKEHIHFVYLNQKQSSKSAISNYVTQRHKAGPILSKINTITYQAIDCTEAKAFAKLMGQHEILMSDVLETKTVQETIFPDFKGVIKSLGAWGGDFVLVVSKENPTNYFRARGYTTVLSYDEMVL